MKDMTKTMPTLDQSMLKTGVRPVSWLARGGRIVYLLCAGFLAVSIVVQVFFAGAGVLVHPSYWNMHRTFGPMIQLLAMGLLIVGVFSRLPWRLHGLNVLLFLLYMMQYVFLWVLPRMGVPALRALHAVNALIMFWLVSYLTRRAWQLSREHTLQERTTV